LQVLIRFSDILVGSYLVDRYVYTWGTMTPFNVHEKNIVTLIQFVFDNFNGPIF